MPTDTLDRAFECIERVVATAASCVANSDECLDTTDVSELLTIRNTDALEPFRQGLSDVGQFSQVTQLPASFKKYSMLCLSSRPTLLRLTAALNRTEATR